MDKTEGFNNSGFLGIERKSYPLKSYSSKLNYYDFFDFLSLIDGLWTDFYIGS